VLLAAHRAAEQHSLTDVTDDAGLAEALGVPVRTVAGSELCFKVTTPYDLRLAHAMAAELGTLATELGTTTIELGTTITETDATAAEPDATTRPGGPR
jgi:hypothetical protein